MRGLGHRLLVAALVALGALPLTLGGLMLSSGPDGDSVGGWDWAPAAIPLMLLGITLLAIAWRRRRPPPA